MSDTGTIARPYAQALFEIAIAEDALTQWSEVLTALAGIVIDEDGRAFLSRPDLSVEASAEFVTAVGVTAVGVDAGVADLVRSERGQNLIRLLVENGRIMVLPDISARFDALKADAENTVKVTLVTATDADSDVAERIVGSLEKKLGRKVQLELELDGDLLGGAVIRADDMVIDGSVKSKLRQLAESLVS
ncbi:MAG: F0F1 ATP synthase subunit delta [Candidatus Rariloculaceae bacterium]